MCLAIPVPIVELRPPGEAVIEQDGVRRVISTAFVEPIAVGDYVILHVGYALTRLDPEEARLTLQAMRTDEGSPC